MTDEGYASAKAASKWCIVVRAVARALHGTTKQGRALWRIDMRRSTHPLRVVSISDEMRTIEAQRYDQYPRSLLLAVWSGGR